MGVNREVNRQVVETVFGGLPRPTTLIMLAEVWADPDDGMWHVTVESGYLLTDLHREPDMCRSFARADEAATYAKSVSTEWRVYGSDRWNEGDRR